MSGKADHKNSGRLVGQFRPGHPQIGGRRKGRSNKATVEIRERARQIVEDPQYVASLQRRLIAGKAPHMETLLFQFAYGKPAFAAPPQKDDKPGLTIIFSKPFGYDPLADKNRAATGTPAPPALPKPDQEEADPLPGYEVVNPDDLPPPPSLPRWAQ